MNRADFERVSAALAANPLDPAKPMTPQQMLQLNELLAVVATGFPELLRMLTALLPHGLSLPELAERHLDRFGAKHAFDYLGHLRESTTILLGALECMCRVVQLARENERQRGA